MEVICECRCMKRTWTPRQPGADSGPYNCSLRGMGWIRPLSGSTSCCCCKRGLCFRLKVLDRLHCLLNSEEGTPQTPRSREGNVRESHASRAMEKSCIWSVLKWTSLPKLIHSTDWGCRLSGLCKIHVQLLKVTAFERGPNRSRLRALPGGCPFHLCLTPSYDPRDLLVGIVYNQSMYFVESVCYVQKSFESQLDGVQNFSPLYWRKTRHLQLYHSLLCIPFPS